MSKKLRSYILLSLFGIYLLLNLIIFLVIFNSNLNIESFWLTWSFAYPISYALTFSVVVFGSKIKKFEDVTVVPSVITTLCFDLLFVIASFIFMFVTSVDYKLPLIIDLILLLGFFIVEGIIYIGMSSINSNNRKQKQKVFYIRDLESEVKYISQEASDVELKKTLDKLAEDIRFSDPMSHESLKLVEEQIRELIFRLKGYVESNSKEDIESTIKEINLKLQYRNEKCINLK